MSAIPTDSDPLRTRVDGSGPGLLCLHSSAGSSQQWEALVRSLAPGYRVVRVDSLGHGRSPDPAPGAPVFAADVRQIAPLLQHGSPGVHLVGHSYGAALAVALALAFPHRVRSLALYEPVLFSLLDDARAPKLAREEVTRVGHTIGFLVRIRQPRRAARWFMDYWAGPGSWARLDERQKQAIAARMPVVAGHFESIFASGMTLARLRAVQVPTLLLHGANAPASTQAIVGLLATAWPHAERKCFEGLGHLGPITHPERVNPVIARFVESVQCEIDDATLPALAALAGPHTGQAMRLAEFRDG